jgi:hypothetical protein
MENQEESQREGGAKRFCSGPPVPEHQIQYDEVRHAWIIDQVLLLCSVAEYRCLNALLASVDRCVPFAALVACLDTTGSDAKQERMRLAHIMSSLRVRLWPLGFDIGSVMNIGYILLSGTQGRTVSEAVPPCPGEASRKEQYESRM